MFEVFLVASCVCGVATKSEASVVVEGREQTLNSRVLLLFSTQGGRPVFKCTEEAIEITETLRSVPTSIVVVVKRGLDKSSLVLLPVFVSSLENAPSSSSALSPAREMWQKA